MSTSFTYLKTGNHGYITQVIGFGMEWGVQCKTQFDSAIMRAEERIVINKLERLLISRDMGDKKNHFLNPDRRKNLDSLLRFLSEIKRNNSPGGIARMIHAHQMKLLDICPLRATTFNKHVRSMIDWAKHRHKYS